MIGNDLHEGVGDAGVIDVMRAVPAAASIETPTVVDLANAQHLSVRSTTRFGVGNLLAGILGDLVTLFERDGCEAAFAVYRGRLDC